MEARDILIRPLITEKTTQLMAEGKYVFVVAKAANKIEIAKAEGAAKAMRIKADAEAYYNKTIAASLSPMIVQEDMIEKWDGKMPQIVGGNGMMLDISKVIGSK